MTKPALLPNGFMDLLPGEAEQEAYAIQTLMDHFKSFGYRRIKPPMAEFEDTLLADGPGAAMARDTFRVMDTVSGRMMGIRADITPQIARIVSTLLKNETKPLRLSYANDVLRARSGQLRSVRQFCQVGCEMVGDEMPESTVEMVMVALLGLKALGIQNITLDFAMPRAFDLLCPKTLSEAERDEYLKILGQRDQSALDGEKDSLSKTLLGLLRASGNVDEALPALMAMKLPKAIKAQVQDLKDVCTAVKIALSDMGITDIQITVDPFESKGSGYYKGLAFSLFARDVRGELGRGGHYGVQFGAGDSGLTATGFTLYMDTIRQSLAQPARDKVLAVLPGASWKDIRGLQDEGWITVLVKDQKEAVQIGENIYKSGKICHLER